jgi:hypothetical protein
MNRNPLAPFGFVSPNLEKSITRAQNYASCATSSGKILASPQLARRQSTKSQQPTTGSIV